MKNYELLDDITMADIAFRTRGRELDELFFNGAMALMSEMMEDTDSISKNISKEITLNNEEIDLLYFDFLQEFIFFKDSEFLLLLPGSISIEWKDKKFILKSTLTGEKIDLGKHQFRVDIKAVTMHHLKVEKKSDLWFATAVIDV